MSIGEYLTLDISRLLKASQSVIWSQMTSIAQNSHWILQSIMPKISMQFIFFRSDWVINTILDTHFIFCPPPNWYLIYELRKGLPFFSTKTFSWIAAHHSWNTSKQFYFFIFCFKKIIVYILINSTLILFTLSNCSGQENDPILIKDFIINFADDK